MTDAETTPAFETIAEDMAFLDDWEDRYRYVIELGKAMPAMPDALKTPATKVDGCASQVWIATRRDGDRMDFDGDSDAMIVRGLIAVLKALYAGRRRGDFFVRRRPDNYNFLAPLLPRLSSKLAEPRPCAWARERSKVPGPAECKVGG